MSDLIARLARACAHGNRQMGFVNELLAGEGYRELDGWERLHYGDSRMQHSSWNSLKKRLIDNGFIIKMGDSKGRKLRQTIEMRFSA